MAKRHVMRIKPHNPRIDHGPKVDPEKIIGPFPGSTTPSRVGPYKRKSPTSGKLRWSYWNGTNWGKMGTNFRRAIERKNSPSHWQSQEWYGISK